MELFCENLKLLLISFIEQICGTYFGNFMLNVMSRKYFSTVTNYIANILCFCFTLYCIYLVYSYNSPTLFFNFLISFSL